MVYLYQKAIIKIKWDDGWKSTSSTIKNFPNVVEWLSDSRFHHGRPKRTKQEPSCWLSDKRQELKDPRDWDCGLPRSEWGQ